MQSDSHGHDAHGHDVTASNREDVPAGSILAWGIAMFLAVLICIGFLTGYFWSKHDLHFGEQVGAISTFGNTAAELDKAVTSRLQGYKSLGEGRYQIPVEEAKKKLVEEGL